MKDSRILLPLAVGGILVIGRILLADDIASWLYAGACSGVMFVLFRKEHSVESDGVSMRSLMRGIPLIIGSLMVAGGLLWIAYLLDFPGIDQVTEDARASSGSELAWILVRILVATAFLEELLFRGTLWGVLFMRISTASEDRGLDEKWAIVAFTAILYGLWHANSGPLDILVTTGLGILFGWFREWSQGIWASVLLHGSINASGAVAYFWATR